MKIRNLLYLHKSLAMGRFKTSVVTWQSRLVGWTGWEALQLPDAFSLMAEYETYRPADITTNLCVNLLCSPGKSFNIFHVSWVLRIFVALGSPVADLRQLPRLSNSTCESLCVCVHARKQECMSQLILENSLTSLFPFLKTNKQIKHHSIAFGFAKLPFFF